MEAKIITITEEQKARLRGAESLKELIAAAEKEGIELTDDQLEALSGGEAPWASYHEYWVYCYCGESIRVEKDTRSVRCPKCGTLITIVPKS